MQVAREFYKKNSLVHPTSEKFHIDATKLFLSLKENHCSITVEKFALHHQLLDGSNSKSHTGVLRVPLELPSPDPLINILPKSWICPGIGCPSIKSYHCCILLGRTIIITPSQSIH